MKISTFSTFQKRIVSVETIRWNAVCGFMPNQHEKILDSL